MNAFFFSKLWAIENFTKPSQLYLRVIKCQGHIETIFDCKFCPRDPYKLATASFDGTLKVWDTSDLSCVESSPGNEGIIYTLCWSPSGWLTVSALKHFKLNFWIAFLQTLFKVFFSCKAKFPRFELFWSVNVSCS